MAAPNPFENAELENLTSQRTSMRDRSLEFYKKSANEYGTAQTKRDTTANHASNLSDPSLGHHLQASRKSIDLLEVTAQKNQILHVQQLQQKVQQLQQQNSFQKKEYEMKIEDRVMQAIQNRDDLLK